MPDDTHDEIWTCRDGRKIPVGEMFEDHVRNALRMILRKRRKLAVQLIAKPENEPEDISGEALT
jgi:hypothetical protein